jgi:hypothetical protein
LTAQKAALSEKELANNQLRIKIQAGKTREKRFVSDISDL